MDSTGEERRIVRLRSERLEASATRVAAPGAVVRIGVASEHVARMVPVVRETVQIERQRVYHGAAAEITGARTLVIPLSRERVVVAKHTVVEENVAIGVRERTATARVRAGIRSERLRVAYDDAAGDTV